MATGYTSDITDTTTLNEFILRCARAFGACIEMRDESLDTPIPEEFKASTYHREAAEEARAELKRLNKLELGEIAHLCDAHNKQNLKSWEESKAEKDKLRNSYNRLLKLVKAWKVPTKDHTGLKDFMIEQLIKSIEWDCNGYDEPKVLTPLEWVKQRLESQQYNIDYHIKGQKEEEARIKERNEWVKALRESIR